MSKLYYTNYDIILFSHASAIFDIGYYKLGMKGFKAKFGFKTPMFGAADITNYCNLHCKHCYWWVNRKDHPNELDAEGWRRVINNVFKKLGVLQVSVQGGEPYLRPDIIEVFCEEMPYKIDIVTNGTIPMKFFKGVSTYVISIDGPKEIHDMIRGPTYDKIKRHVEEFVQTNGKKGKKFFTAISMTINSLNYKYVEDVVKEWHDLVEIMVVQFHTPFSNNDPLWLPYGKTRDRVIDDLIRLKKEYNGFIPSPVLHLKTYKKSWGSKCPSWIAIGVDSFGRIKTPCPLGSAEESMTQPVCERCGCVANSMLYSFGVHGNPSKDANIYAKFNMQK